MKKQPCGNIIMKYVITETEISTSSNLICIWCETKCRLGDHFAQYLYLIH